MWVTLKLHLFLGEQLPYTAHPVNVISSRGNPLNGISLQTVTTPLPVTNALSFTSRCWERKAFVTGSERMYRVS